MVMVATNIFEPFDNAQGFRQGDPLSWKLYNIITKRVMRNSKAFHIEPCYEKCSAISIIGADSKGEQDEIGICHALNFRLRPKSMLISAIELN